MPTKLGQWEMQNGMQGSHIKSFILEESSIIFSATLMAFEQKYGMFSKAVTSVFMHKIWGKVY